jgi:hypothetical protein
MEFLEIEHLGLSFLLIYVTHLAQTVNIQPKPVLSDVCNIVIKGKVIPVQAVVALTVAGG